MYEKLSIQLGATTWRLCTPAGLRHPISPFDQAQAGHRVELHQDYLQLSEDELAFYKEITGLHNEADLVAHIVHLQEEAYQVFPYPCIRWFDFVRLRVSRFPAYKHLLELGKDGENAFYLDLGTCFGGAIRKPVLDGFPAKNCIASDLRRESWEIGYKLFKDSPDTFPAPFVQGDVTDPIFLQPVPPIYTHLGTPPPDLSSLTSLTPLAGRLSAIHTSYLFNEEKQLQIAQALAGLLSPLPGSMIFGQNIANTVKGMITIRPTGEPIPMFCHSPQSWEELWNGMVFKKWSVKVEMQMTTLPIPKGALDHTYWQIILSVRRRSFTRRLQLLTDVHEPPPLL